MKKMYMEIIVDDDICDELYSYPDSRMTVVKCVDAEKEFNEIIGKLSNFIDETKSNDALKQLMADAISKLAGEIYD